MKILSAILISLFCSNVFAASLDWFIVKGKVKSYNKHIVTVKQDSGMELKVIRPLIEGDYTKLKTGQFVKAYVHKSHFALLNYDK